MIGQAGAVAWGELWDELGPMALQLQKGAVFSRFDNLLCSKCLSLPVRSLSDSGL